MVDFLACFTLLTSLPRRAGSNSDSLDHISPAGKTGATTMAAQYDTMQMGEETTTNLRERESKRKTDWEQLENSMKR